MLNAINSATQCNGVMLPPGVQNVIHADGVPRLRFDQDNVQERKVRIADYPGVWPDSSDTDAFLNSSSPLTQAKSREQYHRPLPSHRFVPQLGCL
jgi:hypothetical protein